MGGLAFASCDSSEPRNVLGGMDPFETGEAPSLAIRERGTLDEAESSKGLPGSYVPGENDSWERATPLNEMRMGGILSLSGTLEAGLSLKGDGNGSTWADEDWYLLHVQCHGEVSWGIDGEGLYAAGWFLPASASSPQELSILGVASPGDAGKADLPSRVLSFFPFVRRGIWRRPRTIPCPSLSRSLLLPSHLPLALWMPRSRGFRSISPLPRRSRAGLPLSLGRDQAR